jgi:phosphotransferase system HPr-like phosphotransfer protein
MNADTSLEAEFVLKWRFGLRTAMLIVERARRFRSNILLCYDGFIADAKDHLAMAILGDKRPSLPDGSYDFGPDAGARMRLTVAGDDAAQAMDEFTVLFTAGETVLKCPRPGCPSTPIMIDYSRGGAMYACSNRAELHMWHAPARACSSAHSRASPRPAP